MIIKDKEDMQSEYYTMIMKDKEEPENLDLNIKDKEDIQSYDVFMG